MSGTTEESEPWDGVERRANPTLSPETIDALTKTHQSMAAVATAMVGLTDALSESVLRQGRGTRNWLIAISLAVFVIGGVVIWGRIEGRQTSGNVREVLSVATATNEANAFLVSCLQDEESDCYTRLRLNEKVVTDADRQLLAQEIMCVGFRLCPPGMTPENVPDLDGLVYVPEPEEAP